MQFSPSVYEHAARLIGRTPWDVSRDPRAVGLGLEVVDVDSDDDRRVPVAAVGLGVGLAHEAAVAGDLPRRPAYEPGGVLVD